MRVLGRKKDGSLLMARDHTERVRSRKERH